MAAADPQRDDLERWLRDMMRRQGVTAEAWARNANVSATSITRFLKDKGSSWPSARTLAALARVAGSSPPLGVSTAAAIRIPLIPSSQLIDHSVVELLRSKRWQQMTVAQSLAPGCVALYMSDGSLEAAGIIEADTVILDPHSSPKTGDLVLISTGQWIKGGAYSPPVVVERPMVVGEPTVWPLDLVKIRGVIRHVMRDYPV